MVNREGNFNRSNAKRLKGIRDKKKSKVVSKRSKYGREEGQQQLTNKQERKQKNLKKVLQQLNVKEGEFLSKTQIRRRNKRNKHRQSNNMEVDDN